ncbi:hypothetical protein M430DRAFT_38715 [Amorphotheca resinae ATCC 22711]|uniref:NADP-dependent oxidoreductase domain-containing protein n=1 Tax=Amorphotheca resinae ATCC 22711 TaxID=857342 RepID=A0A2T3BF60_AMORE|nr:hypothetical protein M430DRAFT_38715 [Amorphotheca resinae ATCC 22711]PSS28019.1 hypothetical protein M430DRAFT_38715 [Amorphotheca resinae ATCC 22711]
MKIHRIDRLEAEVPLWATDIFMNGVAETCAELGITICAHIPLGAGMLRYGIRSPKTWGMTITASPPLPEHESRKLGVG